MSQRSYLQQIAGPGLASRMLTPPRMLFAPTAPQAELAAPQESPAAPQIAPALQADPQTAPVERVHPRQRPGKLHDADVSLLPPLIEQKEIVKTVAEGKQASAVSKSDPVGPEAPRAAVAAGPVIRAVSKTSGTVVRPSDATKRAESQIVVPSRLSGLTAVADLAEPERRLVTPAPSHPAPAADRASGSTMVVLPPIAKTAEVAKILHDSDDDSFRRAEEPEVRLIKTVDKITLAPQLAPAMVLRPREIDVSPEVAPVKSPVVEKSEARTIRLEPPRPPAHPVGAADQTSKVRIGYLEVRVVQEAPAAAVAQSQATPAPPARKTAQVRTSAQLARGFGAFGLTQG